MQKRSGVPLLRFSPLLKFLHTRPFTPGTDIQAQCEAYVTLIQANPSLSGEPLDFTAKSISYLGVTPFPLTAQAHLVHRMTALGV